jgi:putative phage-type endonuclease
MTTDFHEARRSGIGGSDIASILGLNAYKNSYQVYLEKVEGKQEDLSNNESVILGNLLEDPIANKYEEITGEELYCTSLIRHPAYPYIIGHPDRLSANNKKIIEVKTRNERLLNTTGKPLSSEMLEMYTLQVSHYMLVSGWKEAELVVSVVPEKTRRQIFCTLASHILEGKPLDFSGFLEECSMHRYSIQADRDIEEIILSECHHFWKNHVEKRVPPDIDYRHPNAKECLKNKYNLVSNEVIELDARYVELKNNYISCREEIKMLEKKSNEIQSEILGAMMNCGIARFSDGSSCFRKLIKSKGYTVSDREYVRIDFKDVKKGEI